MSDGFPAESAVLLGALAGAIVVASCAAWWFWRRARAPEAARPAISRGDELSGPGKHRDPPPATDASEGPQFIRFDEPSLDRVERAFEELVAKGVLAVETSTAEALVIARVPAHAGPAFRALARRYRSIGLPEVGVRIVLHDGEVADDELGGWRLRAEPDELDLRLAPPAGWPGAPGDDVIIDATWSPRSGSEVAQHSTVVHFIVRAAVGDRI